MKKIYHKLALLTFLFNCFIIRKSFAGRIYLNVSVVKLQYILLRCIENDFLFFSQTSLKIGITDDVDWENIRNEDDSNVVGERVQNEDRNLAGSGIKDKNRNHLHTFGNFTYLRNNILQYEIISNCLMITI